MELFKKGQRPTSKSAAMSLYGSTIGSTGDPYRFKRQDGTGTIFRWSLSRQFTARLIARFHERHEPRDETTDKPQYYAMPDAGRPPESCRRRSVLPARCRFQHSAGRWYAGAPNILHNLVAKIRSLNFSFSHSRPRGLHLLPRLKTRTSPRAKRLRRHRAVVFTITSRSRNS